MSALRMFSEEAVSPSSTAGGPHEFQDLYGARLQTPAQRPLEA